MLDGHGERVDEGPTQFSVENDREMWVGLRPGLEPGYYVGAWQTLSDLDGHLLRGSFPFTILAPDGSEPAGPRFAGVGESGGTPTAGPVAVKWAVYLAAFVLVGGMFYGLIVTPVSGGGGAAVSRRSVYFVAGLGAAALLVAGAAELLVQAAQIGGLSRVGDALDTAWGARWWQRELAAGVAVAAVVGAYALRRVGRDGWARGAEVLALAAGLGCLFLLAAISHGASVDGSFWAVAADFIHLAAAAVWAGMLVQLVLVVRWSGRLPDGERAALATADLGRFSAVATAAVLVLLATGVFSAFVEVDSLLGLVDTGYGVTLVAKLALLAPLLAVAAINATVVGPTALAAAGRAGTEAAVALRRLGRLAAVEVAIIAAVVAVAAVLVQFPTARQEAESAAFAEAGAEAVVGYEETRPAGDLSVNVSIAPNAVLVGLVLWLGVSRSVAGASGVGARAVARSAVGGSDVGGGARRFSRRRPAGLWRTAHRREPRRGDGGLGRGGEGGLLPRVRGLPRRRRARRRSRGLGSLDTALGFPHPHPVPFR